MVIPQITALDIDSWTQIGRGGGMSKCYLTWDGDFKWGGTDDMYMGMLSGGLAGMSRQWWDESGGYDDKMLGWGGENIDQGVRMWVCGGEIVAAPNSQVAHMWRTGSAKTSARYKHVGDTIYNRARAINAWLEEFSAKLDDYPNFAHRKSSGGANWFGDRVSVSVFSRTGSQTTKRVLHEDMSTFNNVKKRLNGCRPFAWYLKRFKVVYEDAGLIPPEIFMIREDQSGLCLRYMGGAGTSGSGSEGVRLENCDQNNHRFFWHLGNRNKPFGCLGHPTMKCCSGLRAWNTDQCLQDLARSKTMMTDRFSFGPILFLPVRPKCAITWQGGQSGGRGITGICELSGTNPSQAWSLTSDGLLKKGSSCLGPANSQTPGLKEAPCVSFRNKGGSRFSKMSSQIPLETKLYRKAQQEHPEVFARLNAELNVDAPSDMPKRCLEPGRSCIKLYWKGSTQCLDAEAQWEDCGYYIYENQGLKQAETMACLDTWSDEDVNTWGLYECHGGNNQKFFVTVVLKAAKLREEAQTNHEGSDGSLQRAIVEAENEVEMLAFLLEEADSSEAEVLLEMEAQLQEPKAPLVAAHLRAQIAELQGRKQRSLSPPDREGHCDGDGEVSA
eukprot:s735_g18.t1